MADEEKELEAGVEVPAEEVASEPEAAPVSEVAPEEVAA